MTLETMAKAAILEPPALIITISQTSSILESIQIKKNRARHEAMVSSSYANPEAGDTAGPHGSGVANKLDSDLDNRAAVGSKPAYLG